MAASGRIPESKVAQWHLCFWYLGAVLAASVVVCTVLAFVRVQDTVRMRARSPHTPPDRPTIQPSGRHFGPSLNGVKRAAKTSTVAAACVSECMQNNLWCIRQARHTFSGLRMENTRARAMQEQADLAQVCFSRADIMKRKGRRLGNMRRHQDGAVRTVRTNRC